MVKRPMLTRYNLNIGKRNTTKTTTKQEIIIPIGITLPIPGIIRPILHPKNARAVDHHLVGLLVVTANPSQKNIALLKTELVQFANKKAITGSVALKKPTKTSPPLNLSKFDVSSSTRKLSKTIANLLQLVT